MGNKLDVFPNPDTQVEANDNCMKKIGKIR